MSGPKPPAFETLGLHAGQHPDPVTGARAVPIYQTRLRSSFRMPIMQRRCSIWSAPGTSTPASPTPPRPCWRSGSRRWKAAWAPFARRAAWPRCTSPLPRCSARATISWRPPRFTAAPSICSRIHCRASASPRHSSSRATSTASGPPCAPIPASSSRRPSAIPASKCSTFPRSPASPTPRAFRSSSTTRSQLRI